MFARSMFRYSALLLLSALAAASTARAQFVILAQDEDTVQELRNASTLTFASEGVGDSVTVRINVNYQGDFSTATVEQPELEGSRAFSIRAGTALPATLGPGRTIDFEVTFTPTGAGPFSNRMTLRLTQNELGRRSVPMNVVQPFRRGRGLHT